VFIGGTGGPFEIWSWRLNLSNPIPGVNGGNYNADRVADYAADVQAFHTSAGANICQEAMLTQVKLAEIGPDGKYTQDPLIVSMETRGGNGAMKYPLQVAHCVSLEADRRGASGKGRFYIPGTQAAINPDNGLISVAAAEAARGAVVTLLNNLHNVPGLDPANVPRVTVASTKGYNSDVTKVRVGRALDTIRTRRNSLSEQYTTYVDVD
jgi:hypothetical protein